jgi:hypothetical protein
MFPFTVRLEKIARLGLGLALLAWISVPAAHAGVVYATGFENPPFVAGNPWAGQDSWLEFGSAITSIETFNVFAGSQAAFLDGSGTGQSGPYHADSPTGPLIELSAEIYIYSSSSESEWQFAALAPALSAFIGGINLVPTDTSAGTTDNIELLTGANPVVGTFNLNVWNNVDFVFDMTTQTYNFSLNGTLLGSGAAFCGSDGTCTGANIPAYGDSLFDVFGVGGTDSALMDNFSLANVPEPGSLLLFGSGLALLIRRKLARG